MEQINTMKEIRKIHRTCSEGGFRMSLQLLMEKGKGNFTEEAFLHSKKSVQSQDDSGQMMTNEFRISVMEIALALSKFDVWDVFLYVKLHVGIDGDDELVLRNAERHIDAYLQLFPQRFHDLLENEPDTKELVAQEMVSAHRDEYTQDEVRRAMEYVISCN